MKKIKKVLIKNPEGICPSEIQVISSIVFEKRQKELGITKGKHHALKALVVDNKKFPVAYLLQNDKKEFVEFGLTIQFEDHSENINLNKNEFEVIF